ncbi:MAG: DUF4091 domain-containing protein [Myxococcales bacterium]|nr:DUF4091 domain-containing protein [Myxococcales bacterium]
MQGGNTAVRLLAVFQLSHWFPQLWPSKQLNALLALALTLGLACIGEREARGQVADIWTVGDGEKIRATEASGARSASVALFGMRNETLSFQIVLPVGPNGASGVSLQSEGMPGVSVAFFREGFVEVSERSHGLVWKPGSAAEPSGLLGDIPDRLLPLASGEPMELLATRNQVIWVDLWIGPNALAGTVTGRIVVKAEAGCEGGCEIPVEIELLDRDMPDEIRARSMVWFSGSDLGDERVAGRYFSDPATASAEEKAQLRLRHYQLAKRHRISFFGQHEDIDEEVDDLLSGRAFTRERGYEGPGEGRGLDLLVFHAYGGELESAKAAELLEESRRYSELRDVFVYVFDEPGAGDRGEINRRAEVSNPVPSFVTTLYAFNLDTDIFALPAGMYSRSNAAKGRAAGKKVWIYNGERPYTGSYAIDDVAVAPRVNPWIQYKHDIPRWFYWEATYYYDFQGKRGAIDVANEALNFTNRHGDRVNGDGLLMYPGRDLLFPESDAGVQGPLPSIRLKNWRRGIEDVEYLVMAREAGFSAEVDALLEALLPAVVDQVGSAESVSFPEDGASWQRARRYLFELLRDGHSDMRFEPVARRVTDSAGRRPWAWALAGFFLALGAAMFVIWRRRRGSQVH